LRFEFEVTDKPDIAHGKGAPGKGQLSVLLIMTDARGQLPPVNAFQSEREQ